MLLNLSKTCHQFWVTRTFLYNNVSFENKNFVRKIFLQQICLQEVSHTLSVGKIMRPKWKETNIKLFWHSRWWQNCFICDCICFISRGLLTKSSIIKHINPNQASDLSTKQHEFKSYQASECNALDKTFQEKPLHSYSNCYIINSSC